MSQFESTTAAAGAGCAVSVAARVGVGSGRVASGGKVGTLTVRAPGVTLGNTASWAAVARAVGWIGGSQQQKRKWADLRREKFWTG